MRTLVLRAVMSTALIGGAVAAVTPAAGAESTPDAVALGEALDLSSDVLAIAADTPTAHGDASRVTSQPFNDFPSKGTSYVVLSTGRAAELFDPTIPGAQPSTDLGDDDQPDTTTLSLTIAPHDSARCLLVDFAMATEERVHTYTTASPSDSLSVQLRGNATERAVNAGRSYIAQDGYTRKQTPYVVNAVDYWHAPGDQTDPLHNTAEDPRLPAGVSPMNHFTTRDTAEVPLAASTDAQTVDVTVADANNATLDSAAMIDNVRTASSCSFTSETAAPRTGVSTGNAVIVGHRGVGNVLTLDPDASTSKVEKYDDTTNGWYPDSPRPVELRFRWYRATTLGTSKCYSTALTDWKAISDADRQSYVPTNLDKGYCLMVLETGVKDGYRTETYPTAGSQSWYVTLPIQDGTFDAGEVTVSGEAKVGGVLSAGMPVFTPRPDSYATQWYAGTTAISGATGPTYAVTASQAGKTITAKVTAKRSGFRDVTVSSEPYGPIELQTMEQAGTPTITGSMKVAAELTAAPGLDWLPQPEKFTYQWKLDGQNIRMATQATYTPKTTDLGHALTVAVTGAVTGYKPLTVESEPVTIGAAPMSGATPTITGTPRVAEVLTAGTTGWLPAGSAFSYEWLADGTPVGTARTLKVPGSAAGKAITLVVRGTLAGYTTTERRSAPTASVARATLVTTRPTVRGIAKVGGTLRSSVVGWTYGTRFTYQWRLDGKTYSSATRSYWKLPRSARGKRVSLKVTGRLTGYTTASRISSSTSRVAR